MEGQPLTGRFELSLWVCLLGHGQDPGCGFKFKDIRPISYDCTSCKPMHLADAKTSRLLLESEADLNVLDSFGMTLLDIAIHPLMGTLGFQGNPDTRYRRILFLLDHGARISNRGEKS